MCIAVLLALCIAAAMTYAENELDCPEDIDPKVFLSSSQVKKLIYFFGLFMNGSHFILPHFKINP